MSNKLIQYAESGCNFFYLFIKAQIIAKGTEHPAFHRVETFDEVCKLAKEKGFNVPTSTVRVEKIEGTEKEVWDEEECRYITQWETRRLRIITQSLLQRWLREERGIQICIDSNLDFDDETFVYEWQITNKENFDNGGFVIHRYNSEESHSTYELALEDALKYALENLV